MTREEKLNIFFDELSDKSLAYQAGYLRETVRSTIPDDVLTSIVNNILRPYRDQMGLDLEGSANAVSH